MSIAATIAGLFHMNPITTTGASADAAPKVDAKLQDARQALSAIEVEHDALAFAVVTDQPDAEQNLADWKKRRDAAVELVQHLEAALRGAFEVDKARRKKRAIEQRHATITQVKKLTTEQLSAVTKMGAAIQNLNDAFHDYTQTSVEMQNVAGNAGLPLPELVPWFFGIKDGTTRAFINLEFVRTNKFPMTSDGIIHGAFPWVMDGVNAMGGLHVEYGGEDLDPANGKPYSRLKGMRQRYIEQRDAMIARLEQVPIPDDALEPPEQVRPVLPPQPKKPERKSYQGYVASLPPEDMARQLPGDLRDAVIAAKAQLAMTDKVAEGEAIIASIAKADPAMAAMLKAKWKKRQAEVQKVDANG